MPASIVVRVRIGPLVFFSIEGANCREVAEALDGYEILNNRLDGMCSDLAARVYPDGIDDAAAERMEDDDEI